MADLMSQFLKLGCNISDDIRILKMEAQLGIKSYAIYLKILLNMRMAIGLRLQNNPKKIAKLIGYPRKWKLVKRIIEDYDLFEIDEAGFIHSKYLKQQEVDRWQ